MSVVDTLQQPTVHDHWEQAYRSTPNEAFYERAFDWLCTHHIPENTQVLDAGCGPGFHSMRLARRGRRVVAVDCSNQVLEQASQQATAQALGGHITFQKEDLLALSFDEGRFPCVLCWGVLMHITDVSKAVAELTRVLAPGGVLILSEVNMHSPEARFFRTARRCRFWKRSNYTFTPAGVECWEDTAAGPMVTRTANIRWLVENLAQQGCQLVQRVPGQCTELYTRLRWPGISHCIHGWNRLWFGMRRLPGLATGNILVFRKEMNPQASS